MAGNAMEWMEPISWIATLVALVGVHLNNRRRRACFVFWWGSNSATLAVHIAAGLYGLAVRDAIFLCMAVAGFIAWGKKVEGRRSEVQGPPANRQSSIVNRQSPGADR